MSANRLSIAGLALVTYVASYPLAAVQFDKIENAGPPKIMKGYELALLGWQGAFMANFAWFANILFLVALIFVLNNNWKAAKVVSAIAMLLALQTLMLIHHPVIENEGGSTHMMLTHLYAGFFLWVASIAILLGGSIWRKP